MQARGTDKYTILHGDSLQELKKLDDSSIDSCVTDPPYGLSKEPKIEEVLTKWLAGEEYDHGHGGFMGKSWDSFVPHPDIWREVYRVLKPGGHALIFAGTRTQDLMTISLRLAGFEVRDVIEWLYFCLSDDTLALTREGWKSYKELTDDDYVMQWDSETGVMSWVRPEAIHVFPYSGKLLNFKSSATDQLVTPNHRMYVDVKKHSRNEYAGKYEVYEAKDLKRHWHKRFPLAGTYEGDKSIGINRAKLLGWFLTDAWIHGDGKAVMFSQSKPETLAKLRKVLDEADVTYSEYTKDPKKETHNIEHTFYVTGKDVDWLLDNYGDRRFDNELLDIITAERKALLEALIDGDGSRDSGGLITFWSKDEDFRNFVRQLMFTMNMRTSVDNKKGCVRGSTRFNSTELQHKHGIHEVDYIGDVWCVTVPKGAFVVKRNEHVFITGNSGFPKSHDVGKAFDKRNGRNYPDDDFRAYLKERAKESGLTGAQVDRELGTNGMWGHYTGRSQPAFPTVEVWGQLKSLLSLDDRYDEIIHRTEAEREKIGRTKGAQAESTGRYGAWGNDNGNGISEYDITAPATDLAKQWDGWGTALKPAHEPIIVVRKPLEGTVAGNVEEYGTGAINIDESRIGESGARSNGGNGKDVGIYGSYGATERIDYGKGRFPANIVTIEDDAFYSKYSNVAPNITPQELSKKASKSDRNSDWKGEEIDLEPRLIERESPLAAAENRTTSRVNYHPTVKPLDLMAWLVRLVTPPEGSVLDPFAGSGSTLAAAKREGFGFVGVELTDEYIPIIEARTGETVSEKVQESEEKEEEEKSKEEVLV